MSYLARGHTHRVGIDSQASSGRRRDETLRHDRKVNEAPE